MAVRQPQQGKSAAPWIILSAVAGATLAAAYGYPATPVIWGGLLVAAILEPPVILTGPKDRTTGMPTPAGPGEERRQRRSWIWRSLRTRLIVPGAEWLPGWPIKLTWLAGALASYAAALLPVLSGWYRPTNMLAAFIVVAVTPAVRRNYLAPDNVCPGVVIDLDRAWWGQASNLIRAAWTGAILIAISLTTVSFIATFDLGGEVAGTWVLPPVKRPLEAPAIDFPVPWWVSPYALGLSAGLATGLVVAYPLLRRSLDQWKTVVAASAEWRNRWAALKQDPPPRLTDRRRVGAATVDSFVAPAGFGSVAFLPRAPEIMPTVGEGRTLAVLEVPDTDADGQPIHGQPSPTRFEIVQWTDNAAMSPSAGTVEQDVAELAIRTLAVVVCETSGYGRPMPLEVKRISEDGSPGSAWQVVFAWPGGPGMTEIRKSLLGDFQSTFGCDLVIDHRFGGGVGAMYVGNLFGEDTEFIADEPVDGWQTNFERLAYEDQWNSWWGGAKKPGLTDLSVNPPVIDHRTRKTFEIGGATVYQAGFLMRVGADPTNFFGLEGSLKTAIPGCTFVDISAWPAAQGNGYRQDAAIRVTWSQTPVPLTIDRIPPGDGSEHLVMGAINRSFTSARLPLPQLVRATCLTDRTSRSHIWEIRVRLFGGVTLANLRKQHHSIKETLGVPWLRFKERPESIISIFAGAPQSRVTLARTRPGVPDHEVTITGLDWADAFFNAKVYGSDGSLPELLSAEPVPENPDVSSLVFKLPPGLDITNIRDAARTVGANAGHAFFDVRRRPAPNEILVMAAVDDPLPTLAPFDFEAPVDPEAIPFATSPEGTTIFFRPADDPHALLAGTTGSGKSVLAQVILFGALLRGYLVYVIDPVKSAADFRFAKDHCIAMATDPIEAVVVMRDIYRQVRERVSANGAAGVGSFRDLPNPPRRVLVLMDEFTSLMQRDKPGERTGRPDVDAEVERVELENAARAEIGAIAGRITREARSAGVTVALATQQLNAATLKELPGGQGLKTNLVRALLGAASNGERMSALRTPFDAPVVEAPAPKGRGVFEPSSSAATLIQTWFAPQDELGRHLRAALPPLDPADRLDVEAEVAAARSAGAIVEDIWDDAPSDGPEEVFVELDFDPVAFDFAAPESDRPDAQVMEELDWNAIKAMAGDEQQ